MIEAQLLHSIAERSANNHLGSKYDGSFPRAGEFLRSLGLNFPPVTEVKEYLPH
jgi:hypothetical protein